jgi:hypothetical protein
LAFINFVSIPITAGQSSFKVFWVALHLEVTIKRRGQLNEQKTQKQTHPPAPFHQVGFFSNLML